MSNTEQRSTFSGSKLFPITAPKRQPSVTESAARSRLIRGAIMPSLQLKMAQDNPAYTISQLVELRRQMLRFARSLTRGSSERIERRQIAASLGGLYRNKRRLDVHIGEG